MARKPKKLPDYFTTDEARALVTAAPSYPTRMAMRIMLRAGLRVSECLSLCAADLRLSQDPPIIFLRPEVTENKSKKGREVPIPADLVESLGDLASIHAKDRRKPLFDISRQWVSKSMKEAAVEAGLDPGRAHPHALRHTYGRNAVLNGVPTVVLKEWLGHGSLAETERYVQLAGGTCCWPAR
jgi:integrase/recombinase XerD